MIQIRDNAAVITLNRTQTIVRMVNSNVTYIIAPRANGKTFMIGDRIEHLNDVMPRSQILLASDTYARLHERIAPNILNYFRDEAGMIDDEDFVAFKKPPAHWTKPLYPLNKFDHVISFSSGMAICLASQNVPGSANAFNAQALIVDETKYMEEVTINTEILPALRGARKQFGHLPEYRSHWYFTDKYGQNIKWLLAKEKLSNEKIAQAIVAKQSKIFELEAKLQTVSSSATKVKIQHEINAIEEKLQLVRRNMVYFCEAEAYENLEVLGKKYYRDLKRDLGKNQYAVSIENENPDKVENTFYPTLYKKKHYHQVMNDTNEHQPLIAAMDYQWKITPMVVGQWGILPGREVESFNIVNNVHTIHPSFHTADDESGEQLSGGIQNTVQAFCEYYKNRGDKTIYYCFDHTAIGRRPDGKSFKDIAVEKWIENDWTVIEIDMGKAPEHHDKHEAFKKILEEDQVMFNDVRAWAVLKSIENAGTKKSGNKTKKDKDAEKKMNDPVEQTDYSDAFDMLIWAVLEMHLVESYQPAYAEMVMK
jgi:hypothetical protein